MRLVLVVLVGCAEAAVDRVERPTLRADHELPARVEIEPMQACLLDLDAIGDEAVRWSVRRMNRELHGAMKGNNVLSLHCENDLVGQQLVMNCRITDPGCARSIGIGLAVEFLLWGTVVQTQTGLRFLLGSFDLRRRRMRTWETTVADGSDPQQLARAAEAAIANLRPMP